MAFHITLLITDMTLYESRHHFSKPQFYISIFTYCILNRERQVPGINIKSQGFPRITLALCECQNHYAVDTYISIFFCKI